MQILQDLKLLITLVIPPTPTCTRFGVIGSERKSGKYLWLWAEQESDIDRCFSAQLIEHFQSLQIKGIWKENQSVWAIYFFTHLHVSPLFFMFLSISPVISFPLTVYNKITDISCHTPIITTCMGKHVVARKEIFFKDHRAGKVSSEIS